MDVFETIFGTGGSMDEAGTFDVTLSPVGMKGPLLNVMAWMLMTPRKQNVVPPWRICFRLSVGPADQFKTTGIGSRTRRAHSPSMAESSRMDLRGSPVVPSGPDLAVLRRLLEQRGTAPLRETT